VGRIEGGTSVNTVPDRCRVEIDRRLLPGEDAASAHHHFQAWLADRLPGIRHDCPQPFLSGPPLGSAGSEEIVQRLGAAIDSVQGSHQVVAVPYGTDAGPLAQAGVPAVVFGPGDIARAHTCDEWVPLDEVERASEVLYRFIRG
jgi:acetylornithine deacetylase